MAVLGVAPSWLEVLEDLRLRWDGRFLWVCESHRDDDDLMGLLSASLLQMWRFSSCKEGRFLSAGESCRSLMIGQIRGKSCYSDYYLHGWSHMSMPLKRFICVASLVAYIPYAFLSELMADDRVALRLPEMKAAVSDER